MSSAFQVYGLLMDKAVVTLLIRSFRGGQETIAHYLYALSYCIIAVTGGGCFERTEISFIPFQGRIQRSVAITYPFEEQPDSTRRYTDAVDDILCKVLSAKKRKFKIKYI